MSLPISHASPQVFLRSREVADRPPVANSAASTSLSASQELSETRQISVDALSTLGRTRAHWGGMIGGDRDHRLDPHASINLPPWMFRPQEDPWKDFPKPPGYVGTIDPLANVNLPPWMFRPQEDPWKDFPKPSGYVGTIPSNANVNLPPWMFRL